MKKRITVRELITALSGLEQDAMIDMDCSTEACEDPAVPPTIQRRTSRRQNRMRYVLAPAERLGNDWSPLLIKEVEE